jgi:hypothetical protein
MKNPVWALLFLLFFSFSQGQDSVHFYKVNRDSVKAAISDPAKPTYYSKLLKRLNEFDTTLTPTDYRLLYYGYVFDNGYSAYGSTEKGKIYKLLDDKKYLAALNLSDSVLKSMPVSLSANLVKLVVLYTMSPDERSEYNKWKWRYHCLRDAVLSTGNGLTCETAFKTIFVPDEYDLIRYFEIEETTQYLVGDCDMFDIKSAKYFDAKNIYFDTSETLKQLDDMFKKKDK